jgi:hypothetical protein
MKWPSSAISASSSRRNMAARSRRIRYCLVAGAAVTWLAERRQSIARGNGLIGALKVVTREESQYLPRMARGEFPALPLSDRTPAPTSPYTVPRGASAMSGRSLATNTGVLADEADFILLFARTIHQSTPRPAPWPECVFDRESVANRPIA